MKHVQLFREFLVNTVNLNQTRVTSLELSTEAIEKFVEASAWSPNIREWMEQGSWAHKTIIKPVDQGEFDADLLVFVDPVEGWSASDYINELYNLFKASGAYSDKARRWSHCVTITYANDKKIDIAPCVVDRLGFPNYEVCNRDSNNFEQTSPKLYTEWLKTQNAYSGSNSFRKVTRIIKYLRDFKGTFKCSSVLLTTILGYNIRTLDQYASEFTDTPTSLRTIFARMDDWLQINPLKPTVVNPYLYTENFSDLWTDDQYANFRAVIHRYREWIDDAFEELDRYKSIAKWRRVFGDEFASGVVIEEARSVSKAALDALYETARAVSERIESLGISESAFF